jgi:hypothetical protein
MTRGNTAMKLRLLRQDKLHVEFAGAGAVEFGEEDDLPATQSQAAFLDEYGFGGADEGGFDV